MLRLLIPYFLLLFPFLLDSQATTPVPDSISHALPENASTLAKIDRIENMLWYIFKETNAGYGHYPYELDSLNQCCIVPNSGHDLLKKRLDAEFVFFKGSSILAEQPENAKPFIDEAISLFASAKDSSSIAICYSSLCQIASALGDSLSFAKANESTRQLIPTIKDPEILSNVYNNLGISCYDFGRYAEATVLYFKVLDLINEYPTPYMLEGKAIITSNIGGAYMRIGDLANSKLYNEKAIAYAHELHQDPSEYLGGLAWNYMEESNYQKAIEIILSRDQYHPDPTSLNNIATSTYTLARCYRKLGDLKTAMPLAKKGVELLPISIHASFGSTAILELAFCEFESGMTDSSLQHAQLAFKTFSEAKNNGGGIEAAELLSLIYKKQGNFRKALEYSELRSHFQQLIEHQQSSRQLAFSEFSRENDLEKTKRESVIASALKQQRNIRYALFAGIGLMAMLAIFLYNMFRIKKNTAAQLEIKNIEVESARRIAEQERQRAEKSEAFKARFLANMSHEIRTPLHGIGGYTDLLLQTPLGEKQKRWLDAIHQSTEQLSVVVNDILDISKLEAGELRLRQIPFAPKQILSDVHDAISLRAKNKGINLVIDAEPGIPDSVIGDPTRLYQILLNLAGNAVKFTEAGSVHMSISEIKNTLPDVVQLRFSVIDTGIGIHQEKLSSIFESFIQAEDDTTARFGGTGLGLTIARDLVRLFRSEIDVKSTPGEGSEFSFVIDFRKANKNELKELKKTDDLLFSSSIRILLADDNSFNREIAREAILSHFENASITEVVNGREVIEQARTNDYDIILMDVQMPEMNGIEATRIIRSEFPVPKNEIPIIAITASDMPDEIEKALSAGMNRHLPKPFNQHDLVRVIMDTLHLQKKKDEIETIR